MSNGLFRSGSPGRLAGPEPPTPILWIRMLDTMYVKGNFAVLRVSAGALLRVQRGRDDCDFDIPFDRALDLLTAEFAEEAEAPDETGLSAAGDQKTGDQKSGDQLDALCDTLLSLRTALGQIAQLADDGTVPPSRRLPAIAQIAAEVVRRQPGRPAAPVGRKGSWNGR